MGFRHRWDRFRRWHHERHHGGGCGCVVLVVAFATVTGVSLARPTTDTYSHLAFGNPSNAAKDDPDNQLLKKPLFAISYNDSIRIPNWVSWRLTKAEVGKAPRPETFQPDTTLPPGIVRIVHKDYDGGGFDRGHMCPHSDRNIDAAMSAVTFIMTNVIPQSNNNNERAWESLEKYCRELVEKHDKILYIVCGPAGQGGVGRLGFRTMISTKSIRVPSHVWKVILVLDRADDPIGVGPARLNEEQLHRARLICVITPNDESPTREWACYRTSLRKVENLTGYRFFDSDEDLRAKFMNVVDDVEVVTD